MAAWVSSPSTTSFMTSGTATLASFAVTRQTSASTTRHLYSHRYGRRLPRFRQSLTAKLSRLTNLPRRGYYSNVCLNLEGPSMTLRAVKPQHETRTRILDAAEELFMQQGFGG